jgi:hypothetical protein
MNEILIDTPGSVQRDLATRSERTVIPIPVQPSQLCDHAEDSDVAELAYFLWQEHGCPSGSAEADWLEAEQQVRERAHVG